MKFFISGLKKSPNQVALLTFFLALIFYFESPAQAPWGLRQCVDYAIKNNIQLKQSLLSLELSKASYIQSKANLLPSLNGSLSHNYNFGRSIDYATNAKVNQTIQSDNFSINSDVTLFSGFQLMNSLKQSKLDYIASQYEVKKITNDVSLNVVASYLQVLYAEESVNSANDRLEAADKQRARTKIMVDAGNLAEGSLLDADALLSSEEMARVNALNTLESAKLSITQLLELDSSAGFKIERPPVDLPDQSIMALSDNDIFQLALQSLPEIKNAEYKTQSAEKGLAIAKGGFYPRITMYGSVSSGYSSITQRAAGLPSFTGLEPIGATQSGDTVFTPSYGNVPLEKTPFNDQLNDNLGKSIGFSLNIPIFNGLQTQTSVKRAKINVLNTRYTAELTNKQVYKSIQQARLDAISALNRFNAATKNFDAQKRALEYADKKFAVGLLSSLDIITTRNNKTKAESDLLQAKYDFIFKIKILEFYAGKPLTL